MISVLHIAQPADGGVARYVAAAAADQARRGWRVAIAGRPDGQPCVAGVLMLPWVARREPGLDTVAEVRRLRALVAEFRPDVVHLHSAKAGYAGRLAIRGRLPTLFQPHGWSWLAVTGAAARAAVTWERWAARWTTTTVCVGSDEVDLMRRTGISGRVVLVRNGVDVTHFTPEPPVTGPPLAVCVGRCCRQKGQDRLVRAWPLVLARCPDARLAIVGPAPQSPGLRNGIRFTGAVRDVRPWYRAADVVVLPSRWEGLPLTALEALACGTSVVGSGIPGLAEVVAGNVGALVHSGDSAELADAVALRLTDRTLARSEGNAGRAMIVREFDLRDTLDRLAAVTRVASRVVRSRDRPAARGLPASGM